MPEDQTMPLHAWRRQHGEIVCQVDPLPGIGTWRASTWLVANPTVRVTAPSGVNLLQSAQARADALARQTFNHKCQLETCGNWIPLNPSAPTV